MWIDDPFFDQCNFVLFERVYIDRKTNLFLGRIVFFERDRETRQLGLFQLIVYVIDHFFEECCIRSWILFVDEIVISIKITDHIAVIIDFIWIEIAVVKVDENILLSPICEPMHLLLNH